MLRRTFLVLTAMGLPFSRPTLAAGPAELSVGYQLIYGPWLAAIAAGRFEAATGAAISWVKFDSGARVVAALEAGEIQIGVAGSSAIAAGASRGVDLQLFWILDDIAAAEALVVRDGSGIDPANPTGLRGKKIGVPFGSTTHFHLLFALDIWEMGIDAVTLVDLQPSQIASAWERGEIDAAFVWNPVLARLKRTGKVMITSGELSARGKATFDGLIVARTFAAANADFMAQFARVVADSDTAYRDHPEAWSATSAEARAMVALIGGEPASVAGDLALYRFPTLDEQISPRWLGGGADSGAAQALRFTSEFLKTQGTIEKLADDYARVVTPAYAKAALALPR